MTEECGSGARLEDKECFLPQLSDASPRTEEGDNNFDHYNLNQGTKTDRGKFQVAVDSVIDFVFPALLQHPLSAGRLFSYGMYGPLDEDNDLRTGPRGSHKLSVWELDQMCLQAEREDVLAIYMKKRSDIGMLSIDEQESIILQADPKLKRAAGKSMLPQITKEDVYGIFADLSCDEYGYYSFHDLQKAIEKFRHNRIKNYKLVYPKVTTGDMKNKKKIAMLTGASTSIGKSIKVSNKRKGRVSSSVACATMFQRNKGQTNSDVINQTNKYLSKHAYKISDIDSSNESAMTANVRLLRDVEPRCKNPFFDPVTKESTLGKWDNTSNLKGTGMGSLVKAIPSSTTWKRSVTLAPASITPND